MTKQHQTTQRKQFKLLTSEERELLKAQEEVANFRRARQKNAQIYRNAISNELTQPTQKSFPKSLETDKRSHKRIVEEEQETEDLFQKRIQRLRSNEGCIIQKPFHFHGEDPASAKFRNVINPEPTMLEWVIRYQNKTPKRFHTKSRLSQNKPTSLLKTKQKPLTKPHSPVFHSRMAKLAFEGVPKTTKPHLPKPERIQTRAERLKQIKEDDKENKQFKATKLNRKILLSTTGVPFVRPAKVTIPRSPKFHFDKRNEERKQKQKETKRNEVEEQTKRFKAQPMPEFSKTKLSFAPPKKLIVPSNIVLHSEKRATERKQFDEIIERNKQIEAERKQKKNEQEIKKIREEMVFKATKRLPDTTFRVLPSDKMVTIPKSPNFASTIRSLKRKRNENE